MRLNTFNVIEYFSDTMQVVVYSFSDDPEGKKEAEELFRKLAKENEVQAGLECGVLENSGYELYFVHNSCT